MRDPASCKLGESGHTRGAETPVGLTQVVLPIRKLNRTCVDPRLTKAPRFPGTKRAILLFPLVAFLIGGCAPRADIDPDPAAVDAGQIVPVYVGTTPNRHG